MGRGKPVDRAAWPKEGPQRQLLEFLGQVRVDNGMKSLREIAPLVRLGAPRVGQLLRGPRLPVDERQLRQLIRALGGSDEDIQKGVRLYGRARAAVEAVGRADVRWWRRSGYVDQIRQIAPVDGLHGREDEIVELAEFCLGDEFYAWWIGDAWAGKSALMSTFALGPPAGVDIVSFFVTARLAAQSDGPAFVDALLDQLSALVGESLPPLASAGARDAHLRRLLREAASRAQSASRRLVLLVDGLDEDRGFTSGSQVPSIASLLPKVPEPAVRVIVASRPDPSLPDDVPPDHPLRYCRRRPLAISPYAAEIARLAQLELHRLPLHDPLHRDTVGLITASGGGLTLADLEQLTHAAPFQLNQLLYGTFARTIPRRDGGQDGTHQVYLFAHETLQVEAVRQFGRMLAQYRERIYRWADTFVERGWPGDTPPFLLGGYPRMLRDAGDGPRLRALVVDPSRHHRLLEVTGGDASAFTEIAMAQDFFVAAADPDLSAMLSIARRRDELAARNTHVPAVLPAVWVAVGQDVRAESLAHGMADAVNEAYALIAMAEEYARAGRYKQALDVVGTIRKDYFRILGYVGILDSLVEDRPNEVVRIVADAAETTASRIKDTILRDHAIVELAVALARVGDVARADAVFDEIESVMQWISGIARCAAIAARVGDADRTAVLLQAMATVGSAVPDDDVRQRIQVELAGATALGGDIDKAVQLASAIADPERRVHALAQVANAAASRGDRSRAAALARDVETAVHAVPDGPGDAVLQWQAEVRACVGDLDGAAVAARSISDGRERDAALSVLALRLAEAGRSETAEAVARDVGAYRRPDCFTRLITFLSRQGDHAEARRIAEGVVDPAARSAALAALARELARNGDIADATSTALLVERIARSVRDPAQRAEDLLDLANALIAAGDHARARRAAHAVRDSLSSNTLLVLRLMVIADNLGEHDWVAALPRSLENAEQRSMLFGQLTRMLTARGEHQEAMALLAEIPDPQEHCHALYSMARAMVDTDSLNGASALLNVAERYAAAQTESGARLWALLALARVGALLEDSNHAVAAVDRARVLVKDLDNPAKRSRAAIALARIADDSGRRDQAEALCQAAEQYSVEIDDPEEHDEVLRELVANLASQGQYGQAETAAARIEHFSPQSFALVEVVRAAAEAGQLDLAESVANHVVQLDERVKALAAVVRAVGAADPGRVDSLTAEARRVAQEIGWGEETSSALSVLVDALTAAGRPKLAREVADGIELEDFRAEALLAMAKAAEPNRARRLIAEAIVVGRWTVALRQLAQVDPGALAAVADELLSNPAVA
jgi:tetratricopeptide (TPR) repeat protein